MEEEERVLIVTDALMYIQVSCKDWVIQVSKSTGCITNIMVNGTNILAGDIAPCFYRAPTDNDIGGSVQSYNSAWCLSGLDELSIKSASVSIIKQEVDEVILRVEITIGGNAIAHGTTKISVDYIFGLGLASQWNFDTSEAIKVSLSKKTFPRVGIRFALEEQFSKLKWFGRGPQECYPDRKRSAFLGVYEVEDVSELHVPYILPSKSGGRADVKTADIINSSGKGVHLKCMAPAEGVQLNVSRYPMESFAAAKHNYELEADGKIHVHVDAKMMGLGGDDSWSPSVHDEYLVPPGHYEMILEFRF